MQHMQDIIVDPNPVFFPGRLVLDLTEGIAFPIFGHNINTGAQKNELVLFGTGAKDSAVDAGFDNTTSLPEGATNLLKKGELPGGGSMKVKGISIMFEHLKKPAALTAQGVALLSAAAASHTPDIFDGKVLSHCMRLADAAFRPFLRYGTGGSSIWLPSISHLASPRGIKDFRMATVEGPVYTFPDGKEPSWNPSGQGANLLFGLKLVRDQYNAPWSMFGAAATEPGVSIRSNLGYAAAAAAPAAAGAVLAVLDFTVFMYGTRVALAGN